MTDTTARDLADTAAALESGWPIENLNRLRRVRTMADTTDTTTAILDRLTTAHGVADAISFEPDHDGADNGADILREIADEPRTAAELVEMLAGLPALLADAGEVIAKLSAECAGLRARGE